MNTPFYIAKRYLVSKKSHHIINIISGISVAGITIGTMALVIVLSVFNGFEDLVTRLFNSFDPDLKITAYEGKVFPASDLPADSIRQIPGIIRYTEVVEEQALLKYQGKQYIATIKGVSDDFEKRSGLDTMLVDGEFVLYRNNQPHAVIGLGIAYYLGISVDNYLNVLTVYVPRRTKQSFSMLDQAFNSDRLFPSGIFSVQQDFDTRYIIVPIGFARNLLEYDSEVTSIEIGLAPGADLDKIKEMVSQIAGNNFEVKNRYQQQQLLYKIMKSEKLAIFLILTFILIIATFNVIGSLTIIILDKRKDIAVLWSLGASNKLIKRIFLFEGLLVSLSGALLGMMIGGLICWLQGRFGIISLQGGSGSFIIDAYPVKMQFLDFLWIFITVMFIGVIAAWYPVRQISRKFLHQRLG